MGEFRILSGYIAFNGHVFTKKQAMIYNRACDTVDLMSKIRGEQSQHYQDAVKSRNMTFKNLIGHC